MPDILFKKVKCKGYLTKNRNYLNIQASTEDKTELIDKGTMLLGFGANYIQDIYEFKEKEFKGIVVGTFLIGTRRSFTENWNDDYDREEMIIETIGTPIRVARVYFGNNKSRLVPVTKVELLKD